MRALIVGQPECLEYFFKDSYCLLQNYLNLVIWKSHYFIKNADFSNPVLLSVCPYGMVFLFFACIHIHTVVIWTCQRIKFSGTFFAPDQWLFLSHAFAPEDSCSRSALSPLASDCAYVDVSDPRNTYLVPAVKAVCGDSSLMSLW